MRHAIGLIVLILAAGLFFSCTEGEYLGSGGGGNLVIVDRSATNELKNRFIEVEGSKISVLPPGTLKVGFDPASKRKKFSGKKLSAPLYDTDENVRYTGGKTPLGDIFLKNDFTVKVYDKENDPNPSETETFAVTFYNGSGLIDWKK